MDDRRWSRRSLCWETRKGPIPVSRERHLVQAEGLLPSRPRDLPNRLLKSGEIGSGDGRESLRPIPVAGGTPGQWLPQRAL